MWNDRDLIVRELRAERHRQGLTSSEVARRMGWKTHAPLHKLESGRSLPTLGTLRKWARALGRDVVLTDGKQAPPEGDN